jgi:G3E family GTPase
MTNPSSNPIPVTILSGFLGAGKTTLLNNILKADHGLRIAVLVNDFGKINIDAQLVVGVEGENTLTLANGCICCTIRDDLLKATLELVQRPLPPQYIIVEPSGVSDPVSIAQTFLLPELRSALRVDGILAMVDAEQFLDLQGQNAYMAYEQLNVADIIIINKTDLVTPAQLAKLKKDWLYPQARILETSFGQVPLELVIGVGRYAPEQILARTAKDVHVHELGEASDHDHDHEHDHDHDHQHDHSTTFSTWSWETSQMLSLAALRRVTPNLPNSIFRLKGIVQVEEAPDRKAILQMVGTRFTFTLGDFWGEQKPHSQIIAIGPVNSFDRDDLDKRFTSTLSVNQPDNIADKIINQVLTWFKGNG